MKSQEHVIAVVEPSAAVDPSLDVASKVVGRGGRATVVLLMTKQVEDDIRAFAASEDLAYYDARDIAIENMKRRYAGLTGGDTAAVVTQSTANGRVILDAATKAHATSVAVSQHIAAKRGWRRELRKSQVPVVVTPRRAA
jgi:hypothetical protein